MGSTPLAAAVLDREWRPSPEDAADIQGLIISAYPSMLFAQTLMVQFSSAASTQTPDPKGWLNDIRPRITYATGKTNPSVNLALSAAGLKVLDVDKIVLATFSLPFQQGMTFGSRSKFLGDVDQQDPQTWGWSDCPSDPRCVHAQLLLYAEEEATLEAFTEAERSKLTHFGLSEIIAIPQRVELDQNGLRREHFGFADGISQPVLVDGDKVLTSDRTLQEIAAGDIVLGQTNTYGIPAPGPTVAGTVASAKVLAAAQVAGKKTLGLNGTYLVTRQLKQDVAAFWQNMAIASKPLRNESGGAADAIWLAQKAVGRTLTGEMLSPTGPVKDPDNQQTFFEHDRLGFGCPLTSHVRRANPRDGLSPQKGDVPLIIQATNRHRIMRRGRIYGDPIKDPMIDDHADRGLLFQCLNSDIERQFEFVQHTWLLNQMFGGGYKESDPLTGPKCPFTIPFRPVRQRPVLETYITARGGGYFFMPSRRALEFFCAA